MRPEYFDDDHIVFDALHQTDLIRAKGRGKNGHQMKKWIMLSGGNAPGSGCWGRSAGAAVPLSLVKILSLSFPAG